jgi:hypothetical protein
MWQENRVYILCQFSKTFSVSGGKEHRQYEKEKNSFSHFIFFTTTIVFFPKINNSG